MAKILVVDDQVIVQQVIRDLLEQADHEVQVAGGGEEALEMLAEHSFDIITVDLLMPGMNGMELIRRQRKSFPDVKAMIVSGAREVFDHLPPEFAEIPLLTKPFSSKELSDAIALLL